MKKSHPHAIHFLDWKRLRNVALQPLSMIGSSAVNGCHHNESKKQESSWLKHYNNPQDSNPSNNILWRENRRVRVFMGCFILARSDGLI